MSEPKAKNNGAAATAEAKKDLDLIQLLSRREVGDEVLAKYRPDENAPPAELHVCPLARFIADSDNKAAAARRDIARAIFQHGLDYKTEVVPILKRELKWNKCRISEFGRILGNAAELKAFLNGRGYKPSVAAARGKGLDPEKETLMKLLKRRMAINKPFHESVDDWVVYICPDPVLKAPFKTADEEQEDWRRRKSSL